MTTADLEGIDFIALQMRNARAMTLVQQERERQIAKWGDQSLPLGTGSEEYGQLATFYREQCQRNADEGVDTWADVLLEEVYEALAEEDPDFVEAELIQVAAVCLSAIEDIQRKRDAEA